MGSIKDRNGRDLTEAEDVKKNWQEYKEENNRMGNSGDVFKKIRAMKGPFHVKMGTIKERNSMDLTEAKDRKRWQEYTEELYKKDLHDQDNHDVVIIHLEPDIWNVKSIGL